jgi:AcrR family transcriptional regulator
VPKRSPEYREARRRDILDGARRVFAAHGYEGATVVRLEEEIGLSRGAIHNYFPSKWDLFYALAVEDQSRATRLWLDEGYEAVVRHLVEQSPDWLGVYLELARQFRTHPELREQWDRRNPELNERLEARIAVAQAEGEIRDDASSDDVGTFLSVILDGLALRTGFGVRDDVDGLLRLVDSALAPRA